MVNYHVSMSVNLEQGANEDQPVLIELIGDKGRSQAVLLSLHPIAMALDK